MKHLSFELGNLIRQLAETVFGGQFGWGDRHPKCNGGVQRSANLGWKSRRVV